MKKIWVSRDTGHESDLIWSHEPRNMNGYFGLLVGDSYIAEGAHNDFFGVAPGECRRFLVIPDDDWIPVSSGRVPEDGQRVLVTTDEGEVETWTFYEAYGWSNAVIAWRQRVMVAPYKPEVAND